MQEAEAWLTQYREFWEGALDRLASYVENDS